MKPAIVTSRLRPRLPHAQAELEEVRARLAEAEETIEAIRHRGVDALLVSGPKGDQVFTLKGAEKPYRLLIEAINEGAVTVLPDATVLFCNRRFAQMTGRTQQKITGSSFYRFIESQDYPRFQSLLEGLKDSGAKAEFLLSATAKNRVPVLLSLAPLEIDGVQAIGIVATDLTRTKQQEEKLRRLNDELEARVQRRTAALQKANDALADAQRQLTRHAEDLEDQVSKRTAELRQSLHSMEQFCYSLAHDLRAPLRAMSGFAITLLQDYASSLPGRAQDFASRINTAALRMDELIRDLLAYGRINSSEFPLRPVDPAPLIREVIESSEIKDAKIRVEPPFPRVQANPVLLAQVTNNLLSNALKFVSPGNPPNVRVFAQEGGDDWVRLWFHDNGIGIEEKYFERIFCPFERVCSGNFPGTGMGLAIVQKGVERMGGKVGLESTLGKGSRFWVQLKKAL